MSANLGLGLRRPARNSSIPQGQSCRARPIPLPTPIAAPSQRHSAASIASHRSPRSCAGTRSSLRACAAPSPISPARSSIECPSATSPPGTSCSRCSQCSIPSQSRRFGTAWTQGPTWMRQDLQSPKTWMRRDLQSPPLTRDVPKGGNGYTAAIFSSLVAPISILSSTLAWLVSLIQAWASHVIVTWLWSQFKTINKTLATFILAAWVTPWVVALFTAGALRRKGSCGDKEEIDRTKYAQEILRELEVNSGHFYFLYGSHASGKSTLVKTALNLRQCGYIYVHMHEGVNVRDTREWLSTKILQQLPFGLLWSNVLSKVDFFTRILPRVAWIYACLRGKTPIILVVDGVTAFDDKSEALRSILGVAKYVADNRLASFVIVGSGGELVYISRISSALSRARMLRVESVSKKMLVEYIMKKYKELESRESEVHELLRLTGSKILSIDLWAPMLLHKPIEQVKAAYMEEVVYHCFARAGLLDQENHPWVVKLLEALRGNGGRLHVRKLQKIVPLSKVLRINSSNLFSINEKREVCFESEVYMDYAEEILAEDYAVTTNMKKTE